MITRYNRAISINNEELYCVRLFVGRNLLPALEADENQIGLPEMQQASLYRSVF
ncbi:MAG: hypothetical protein RQ758_03675 [Methanomicrobiaceae archaeon]|nr:hypothetical protein [Methanomicrobiaceae archaeon]